MKFKCFATLDEIYGSYGSLIEIDKNIENEQESNVLFNDPQFAKDIFHPQKMHKLHEFLFILSICHSIVVQKIDINGAEKREYCSSSPDELALVSFAKKYRYEFWDRNNRGDAILHIEDKEECIQILHMLHFNSVRKRMSVIIRHNNQTTLFVKGADNIIFERLKNKNEISSLNSSIKKFAVSGLRTLVIAKREIPTEFYQNWSQKYNNILTDINKTENEIEDVRQSIETDLELVGATAIEDLLQDQVPQCIQAFREAGIKFWVLTGDKLETALSIAHSSGIIKDATIEYVLDDQLDAKKQIKDVYRKINIRKNNIRLDQAFIITGEAVSKVLEIKKYKQLV
jgi:magnesium-transporting ATPase (P-type)